MDAGEAVKANVSSFIAELEQRASPIDDELCLTYWEFANTGNSALQPKLVELEMRMHAIFSDPQSFQQVKAWRDGGGLPAEQARIIALLYYGFLVNQEPEALARRKAELDAEISGHYANFRGEVDGKKLTNNDIKDILKQSDDSRQRRQAWEASKQIGPVVRELILELVGKRNETARMLGFRDYYAMRLEAQEIDENELYALLDKLEQLTREPFANAKAGLDARLVKRFGLASAAELYPWHYIDPFFQDAPAITQLDMDPYFRGKNIEKLTVETYDRVGLDIRPSLVQSDLYEREGKDQHAFCLMIGRHPDQVHVLCNVRDNESWTGTMLHEFGHAIYDQTLRAEQQHFLRGAAHTNTTEAIAMLFGRLTHDEAWLVDVLGVDAAEAARLASDSHRQISWQMLVFTRWMMVMTHFERALYADPAQDLNTLWWELVEKYQMLKRPPQREMPDWATKTHIAQAPVYYHNYMLGEMTASQMQHYIEHTLGQQPLVRQPATGAWLRDKLFRQGAFRPWNEALEYLTGEKLNPEHFVRQFVH